jgi:hypothetical protein
MKDLFRRKLIVVFVALVAGVATQVNGYTVADVNHWELQAVDEDGFPTYSATDKVIVTGIILNRPDFMLDAMPVEDYPGPGPGAQWQIYIQGEDNDHAGTAVWMGQCYNNIGGEGTYSNQEWFDEIYRVNHDPCTGYEFAPGDRVKVEGFYKPYNGKTNINELHSTNPDYDFIIELVEACVGLPQPEVITLDDVKDGNDEFIFDQTRLTGCEYYQARLVRINDVNIVDPNDWGPDNETIIRAPNGLTFPVRFGIGYGFTKYACPTGQIDIIGIFDQEDEVLLDGWKGGYRIWVLNYDGNGRVLTDRAYARYNLPGEINRDGKVDFMDFAWFADNWLECVPGTGACGGSSN